MQRIKTGNPVANGATGGQPAGLTGGLTGTEAAARLARQGPNELAKGNRRSALRIVVEVIRQPMLALLLGGGVVYLLLGSLEEAVILLIFACMSIGITVVQEARTERVMEALRDLTSPRALVIRDGQRQRIVGREVVVGDVIVLSEGDRVPADAVLIEATGLSADESLLTGEAVPVRKTARVAKVVPAARAGGEDLPQVFSGSLIVRGAGIAEVTATGANSEIGKIGATLATLETETPHLQQQIGRLVLILAITGGMVSLAVVLLFGLLRGGWLEAVLAGIAVGMSMLPEEFPMVLAVFLAMGAWRISKARVLTRRASAIETLGAASVLCTDKTGTLTENRMRVAELRLANGQAAVVGADLPAPFRDLAVVGTMASAPKPFDPMEKAFHELYPLDGGQNLVRSHALSDGLLAMTQVWQAGGARMAAAKGAPEAIASLCKLGPVAVQAVTAQVNQMAAKGLRVLGLAVAEVAEGGDLPDRQTGYAFQFLGLVGLADPLRAQVPAAVAECRAAGIRVVMITGDYPATARAIAIEAGLQGDRVITGPDVAAMSDAALAQAVTEATIFARIQPEQKLRIVGAFKAGGAVVAMTGDGVNDAPSLRAADIGVAMGGRGTDVAREAASMMLLDDDFGSIVTTIRLGRRIYDNLRKAMSFILAVHVPIAGLALMPLLFGMPLMFAPVHIAFLEMVIDPVCSQVFEAEEPEEGIMRRPPRPVAEPLFTLRTALWSLFQGTLVLAVVGSIVWFAPDYGMSEGQTRALGFAALVLCIVALIFVDRAATSSIIKAVLRPNRALFIALPIVVIVLAVTMLWPPAQAVFGFAPLPWLGLAVPPGAGFAVLVALELIKPIWRRASARG